MDRIVRKIGSEEREKGRQTRRVDVFRRMTIQNETRLPERAALRKANAKTFRLTRRWIRVTNRRLLTHASELHAVDCEMWGESSSISWNSF